MGAKKIELSSILKDWINEDPILSLRFHIWPESSRRTKWILMGSFNIAYILDEAVYVNPAIKREVQGGLFSKPWIKLNPADPQFFKKLRSYLRQA